MVMAEKVTTAVDFIPEHPTLRALREEVQRCRGCALYRYATRLCLAKAPGRRGSLWSARIAMVGEQPGDEEDRQGHPFVGPAGKVLNKALAEAGIDRSGVYVTNAVKHFKFEEPGK